MDAKIKIMEDLNNLIQSLIIVENCLQDLNMSAISFLLEDFSKGKEIIEYAIRSKSIHDSITTIHVNILNIRVLFEELK